MGFNLVEPNRCAVRAYVLQPHLICGITQCYVSIYCVPDSLPSNVKLVVWTLYNVNNFTW